METEFQMSFEQDIHKDPVFQQMTLINLMRKRINDIADDVTDKSIECYKTEYRENMSQNKYLNQVEKCFDKNAKIKISHQNKATDATNDILKLKREYDSEKMNCYHLSSELEINACFKDYQKKFLKNNLQLLNKLNDYCKQYSI